jgi:leucyl-tRNA synthetase
VGDLATQDHDGHFGADSTAVRRAAHKALAGVTDDVERLRFNRCVAHIYELSNAISGALAKGVTAPDMTAALHEAATILVQLLAPMMPHLAEECWIVLGRKGLAGEADWPVLDKALLVEDSFTYPVQVNGKKRAEVEAAVLADTAVQRALEGRPPKKIIIVPLRIVNVVG